MSRYVVIGRLIESNTKGINKVTAYKLYEINTKRRYLLNRETISKAIQNGESILGLKVQYMVTNSGGRTPVLKEDRTFGTMHINVVDGQGYQVGSSNKQVLFEIEGFGGFKVYKTVDSAGCEGKYNHEEMIQLVMEERVIGCTIRKGSLSVCKQIKHAAQEC